MIKNEQSQILIIGGGFAGINTYTHLKQHSKSQNIKIKLISDKDYFLFTPLLHEIAANNLSYNSVQQNLSEVVDDTDFIKAKIESINTKDHYVTDTEQNQYKFDYLIVNTGAVTNYYNIPGAKEFTMPLKTFYDAKKISSKLTDLISTPRQAFEVSCFGLWAIFIRSKLRGILIPNSKIKQPNQIKIVLIGAGPTSIELATEISSYLKKSNRKDSKITIINKGTMPVENFPEFIQNETQKVLTQKHINVINNCQVLKMESNKLFTATGTTKDEIPFDLAIWTAGVTPNYPKFDIEIKTDNQNRIVTNQYLQLQNHNNIYILGDIASIKMDQDQKTVPMLAQSAVQEAPIAAQNILNQINNEPLQEFKYETKGLLISLGKFSAAGQIKNFKISGIFAWITWRTIYLFNFKSWKKRLTIAYEWTIDLFE